MSYGGAPYGGAPYGGGNALTVIRNLVYRLGGVSRKWRVTLTDSFLRVAGPFLKWQIREPKE
jgi:hypothetical protein